MAMPITQARRWTWTKPASELDRRIVREFEAARARMAEMAGRQGGFWRRWRLLWAVRWPWAGVRS